MSKLTNRSAYPSFPASGTKSRNAREGRYMGHPGRHARGFWALAVAPSFPNRKARKAAQRMMREIERQVPDFAWSSFER